MLLKYTTKRFLLEYKSEGAIGMDLHADIESERTLEPGERWKIDTGIAIELPSGWGAFVMPRSGLTMNHGILAATGTIDQDYRGKIAVCLFNLWNVPYIVRPGDRIAQLVLFKLSHTFSKATPAKVDSLDDTDRGDKGFGSTGR